MWQKDGKGLKYRGMYLYCSMPGSKTERTFVLSGLRKDGTVHSISAESPEMAKKCGWVKIK